MESAGHLRRLRARHEIRAPLLAHVPAGNAPQSVAVISWRVLSLAALLVSSIGCAYGGARVRDFADVFRLEANVGYGLQVHANAGELVHTGVGTSEHYSFGPVYGEWESRWAFESHFPLSYIYSLIDPATAHLHEIDLSESGDLARHRCYMLFPGDLRTGELYKSPIHYFDLEVGALAGIIGIEFGFSIGELFDWLLGFFTLDIADDDDPEARKLKTLWNKPVRKEPLIPR